MTTTINGRTSEEIKKGLKFLGTTNVTEKVELASQGLAYAYYEDFAADTLAYIQQLEHNIDELTKKVAQLDQVTRERDALLEIVKKLGECNYCKHDSYCPHTIQDCMNCKDENCKCHSCGHQSEWQWRGVQEGEHVQGF